MYRKRPRRFLWLLLLLVASGAFLLSVVRPSSTNQPPALAVASPVATPPPIVEPLRYEVRSLPQGAAYILTIPGYGYEVTPVVADTLAMVNAFAKAGTIAVLNGGFFDPFNQKSTSFVTMNGKLVADPRQNERLMENAQLAPYLPQILNRSELRRYGCRFGDRYAITRHSTPVPADCRLLDAIGGGPQLLPDLTAEGEGFLQVVNGAIVRDSIGVYQENARSAVGLTSDGSIVWVMVAQRANAIGGGLSLPGLAELMRSLNVTQAMNLDGGSSSALYYQGQTIYGKRNESGQTVQRPVKSVLLLQHQGAPG
jgi:hypothetical protein